MKDTNKPQQSGSDSRGSKSEAGKTPDTGKSGQQKDKPMPEAERKSKPADAGRTHGGKDRS